MKIAVDARILSEPITGIGRYTHEVLKKLIRSDHQWYLYSHRPIIIGEWNQSNVTVRSHRLSGRLMRMIWAQSCLPYLVNNDQVDLFWSPAHRIPRLLSSSIPSVVTIHDLVWFRAGWTMRTSSRWLDSILMPSAIEMAKKVISVSSATTKDLEFKFPQYSKKFVTIPLGVNFFDTDCFDLHHKLIPDKPFILFIGTLEPRKNLKNLIEAFTSAVSSIHQDINLVIVGGGGWGGIDPENLAAVNGMQSRVLVLGYVSEIQLKWLYQRALFLAMPSLYEGFGLPILEAMSHGLPILTSSISSMPELAGDAAVLVNPYDVSSIRNGLIILATDQKMREKLSINAMKISKKYSWEQTAKKTLELFEMVYYD